MLDILRTSPLAFALLAAALVEAIALHEFAHALAADLQGDRMPRAMGRLTLNPAKHLDPLGTLCILLVGFGWGKPVPFRPQAMSSPRFGAAMVALAGPLMNLVLAIASALVIRTTGVATGSLGTFLQYFLIINVLLAVFNLIPLPPLDGSRLLTIFLPPDKQNVIFFLDRYGFMILLALLLLVGTKLLDPVLNPVTAAIQHLAGLR
jgi:Zn-dependent protease